MSPLSGEERTESLNYLSHSLVQVNKRVIDGPAAGWPKVVKRYLEGEMGYKVWFRINGSPYPAYFRAQVQWAGIHHEPNEVATTNAEFNGGGISHPKRHVGSPMLVVVPEAVENPEWVPLRVNSVLRMERLKVVENLGGVLRERFDRPRSGCPLIRSFTDWEFGVVGWAEKVDQVIEARAKAVDAVSDNELQVIWERCHFVNDEIDIAVGLRFHLRERGPVVTNALLNEDQFEPLQVIPRPLKAVDDRLKVAYRRRAHGDPSYAANGAGAVGDEALIPAVRNGH